MKAPEDLRALDEVRKIARRYADGEADAWVMMWPEYTQGERGSLAAILAEKIGLPWEHRRRRYYRDVMEAAMAAYDLRMEARQRTHQRRAESR